MTKALIKNTFREIRNSKARFISIMAIIALGVGFFSGIKATVPSMYNLAENYYRDQQLMDFRLVSTVGFEADDINAVSNVDGVTEVMPSYFCDAVTEADCGGEVVKIISIPTAYKDNNVLNNLVLKSGRLPEKSGEALIDATVYAGTAFSVGDTIKLSPTADDTDITTQLNTLEYTIVGTVESPVYISYQRGSTTIGDGKIGSCMYVKPDDFAFERYTELYVKTDISDKYSAFSDEYASEIEELTKTLETVAEGRCETFDTDVIQKAKNDLNKAKEDYTKEKAKADSKLADAEKELKNGEIEYNNGISQAQNELNDAKRQIENGEAELDKSRDEYYTQIADAEGKIEENEKKLDNAQKQYDASKAEYDKNISAAQAQLESGEQEYNAAYNKFKSEQEPKLLAGISQAQSAVDDLKTAISLKTDPITLAALNAQLSKAQSALDELNAAYSSAVSAIEQSRAKLDVSKAEFESQKQSGKAELDKAKQQLFSGKAELSAAKRQLAEKKQEGQDKLSEAQQELETAKAQYQSGKSELEAQKVSGQKKLDESKAELEKQKAEADKKFAQAKQDIDDAQEKVNNLSEPEWYVFDRDDNPGYSSFPDNADRLDAVATVFPLFFLLVAVLVCVTTMTRLIEEKRTEIGTLKALGYSNMSIMMKFVIYSMLAGILGSIAGTVIGVSTIPFIIYNAYKIVYFIGDINLVLNIPSIILGVGAALLCTTAVSVAVCRRSLANKPAAIMRPKAPKAGKRIFLEHITPLWKHMNFTAKLTARNLLRYKSRLCMTVIGVAGCTALIVAAFGLLNSFVPLTHNQFEDIYKYDAVVVPKEGGTAENLKYLTDLVDKQSCVESYMLTVQEEAEVYFENQSKQDGVYLEVVQNPDELDSIISLHTRIGKTPLHLTDDGVLVNEKLCNEMSLSVGDTIKISSDSGTAEVKINGIYEQYINNYIYMTPTLYKSLYGKEVQYNMLDVLFSDSSENVTNKFSSDLLANNEVAAVSFIKSSLDDLRNMLNSLNMVVFVMVTCAAALAFVVLYNLTNINIAERVREIATFKVLGFYNKETSAFIYIENIVLTLLGIAVGLLLGNLLTGFIIKTVEIDNIMFGREIFASSYIYAAGLTILFSLIVNFVMSFRIKAVDMVESLKSVE